MIISIEQLKESIRNVPDFPKAGIQFKDLTTTFKQPELLHFMVKHISDLHRDKEITKVLGIESRGFILGTALAYEMNAGFVPVRKKGKLPAATYAKTYALEYGEDTIEIHKDALSSDDVVLLHDDLLATGGTANAALHLLEQCNIQKIYLNFIVELTFLKGRDALHNHSGLTSLVQY